jgi:hypothetical protein
MTSWKLVVSDLVDTCSVPFRLIVYVPVYEVSDVKTLIFGGAVWMVIKVGPKTVVHFQSVFALAGLQETIGTSIKSVPWPTLYLYGGTACTSEIDVAVTVIRSTLKVMTSRAPDCAFDASNFII